MFWFVRNLTKLTMESGVAPWEFKPTENLTVQIRKDKKARQEFYQTASVSHHFYTGLEASNPNMRPSKENPVRAIHAFCADYDLPIPADRVQEGINAFPIKPSWSERSLGGNVRLVWVLPRPIYTDSNDYCTFILQEAIKWLSLEMLPGLDAPAFTTTTRLLCNGCEWTPTGFGPIDETTLQAFIIGASKKFRWNGGEGAMIPLDVVEKQIRATFPAFSWPADFTVDSQGPTFWIPESTSPMSAIVREEGMITFSAHATKPFYKWVDLLGKEFVDKFRAESLTKATQDIYWDGKRFFRKKRNRYIGLDVTELNNYLKVNCGLTTKTGPGGVSAIDEAVNHIYNHNDVIGAAPFVFRAPGPFDFMGNRILNTFQNHVLKPAPDAQEWSTNFPFLASLINGIFDPPSQKEPFLAWWKHFYESALNEKPMPGQNIFLMGGANVGKTLMNRVVIGGSVGGFMDASDFLIKTGNFNSELFDVPLWSVDDETAGDSEGARQGFSTMLKKVAANQTFKHSKKFEIPVMLEWMGRVVCTTNLDFVSSRLLGSMDNTSMDKTSLFRCATVSTVKFPTRHVLMPLIKQELPFFLRWLLDWTPPDHVVRDTRFGFAAVHEKSLLSNAKQGAKAAPFLELLVDSLRHFFHDNKAEKTWEGSITKIMRLLTMDPLNEPIMRTLKLEQTNRYLEAIERDGRLKCSVKNGPMGERVWVFERIE